MPPSLLLASVDSLLSEFAKLISGCDGVVVTDTFKALADDEPQVLFAVTRISPEVALAVASIEAEVDAPVQPAGSVHV